MPPFTSVAVPTAQELVFAVIRSGTGIGVEVNSSGGSFGGKNRSRKLSINSAQIGCSSNVVVRNALGSRPCSSAGSGSVIRPLPRSHDSQPQRSSDVLLKLRYPHRPADSEFVTAETMMLPMMAALTAGHSRRTSEFPPGQQRILLTISMSHELQQSRNISAVGCVTSSRPRAHACVESS